MIQKRLNKIGAAVLEVQIVRVFPNIAGHQRGLAMDNRGFSIWRFGDFQIAIVEHQPGPTAAKLGGGGFLEFIFESIEASKG